MIKIMGTGPRRVLMFHNVKEIYAKLEQRVLELAKEEQIILISGMAEGWDEMLATVGERNGIPYWCYVPNSGYGDYYWRRNSGLGRNRLGRFNALLRGAQKVLLICGDQIYVDGKHANFIRNDAMVRDCDMALVYNMPESRGTQHAIRGLRRNDVPFEEYPFTQRSLVW